MGIYIYSSHNFPIKTSIWLGHQAAAKVSILQREADGLKVLASSGDPHLGGRLAERLASHGDGAVG
jgi:hypothetical protein